MRRRWWLLATIPVGVGALPLYLPSLAAQEGVGVERAFWCRQGLCMTGVSRGGIQATSAILGWDRSLTLNHPVISGGHGSGGASPVLPSPLTALKVKDLVVEGLPVKLPPLSGTLLPERHLEGTDVVVDGDTVSASVRSTWGPVKVEVTRGKPLQVRARCAPCSLQSDVLSEEPLRLEAVEVEGQLDDSRFVGTVQAGKVQVGITVERPSELPSSLDELHLQGSFHLDPTPVQDLYGVLASIVPEASRAGFRGTFAADGTFRWPGPELTMTPKLEGFAVTGLVGPEYRRGIFRYSARNAEDQPIEVESGEGSAGWLSLEEIGSTLPMAVIATEDAGFWKHPGYDLAGMLEAARSNSEAGQIEKGGSTITQQLAKNLFLDGRRTYARKLRELLYAVEMERELGKQRILELYLNVVEWGWNLRGAQAAAHTYFLKDPRGLLPEEAAWLSGILCEPKTAWKQQYMAQKPSQSRVRHILLNMVDLSPADRDAALNRQVHLVPPETGPQPEPSP